MKNVIATIFYADVRFSEETNKMVCVTILPPPVHFVK